MWGSFFKLFSFKSPAPPCCRCPGKVTVMPWAGSRGRPGLNNPGTNRPAGAGRVEGVQQPLWPRRPPRWGPGPGPAQCGRRRPVHAEAVTAEIVVEFSMERGESCSSLAGNELDLFASLQRVLSRIRLSSLPWGKGEGRAFDSVRSAAPPRNALS